MNPGNTEFIYFNQDGTISIQNGWPLKVGDQFKCFGSNISSLESDVNIRISEAWTAIDSWSNIRELDLSDKIKKKEFCQ